jgi:hypothetical protein
MSSSGTGGFDPAFFAQVCRKQMEKSESPMWRAIPKPPHRALECCSAGKASAARSWLKDDNG